MDNLQSGPNLFYFPANADGNDSTAVMHGDDVLAEGHEMELELLNEILEKDFIPDFLDQLHFSIGSKLDGTHKDPFLGIVGESYPHASKPYN